MKGIIYKVTNKINNKIYIGETIKPLYDRQKQHYHWAKNNKFKNSKFQNALNKYNEEDFIWEILEVIQDDDKSILKYKLQLKEKQWIESYNSFFNGYNSLSSDMHLTGENNPNYKKIEIDLNTFLEKRKEGYNYEQLSEYFKYSIKQIKTYQKEICLDYPELKNILKQYSRTTRSLGMTNKAKQRFGSENHKWIEINVDWDKHLELAQAGKCRKEIAEYFNITENHLKIWRKRMRQDPIKKQQLDSLPLPVTKVKKAIDLISEEYQVAIINKTLTERKSSKTISQELNLPFKTVRNVREQLGIRIPKEVK